MELDPQPKRETMMRAETQRLSGAGMSYESVRMRTRGWKKRVGRVNCWKTAEITEAEAVDRIAETEIDKVR